MRTVQVPLGPRSYPIAIGTRDAGFAAFARGRLPGLAKALFVADANTRPHAETLARDFPEATVVRVPAGEASKALDVAGQLYSHLARLAADRRTPVVAVGGGVVGDLAGFAAATYNRGLPLLMVPTTLLAMVDSSVGGKVGINLPEGKNLVGAFHQPAGVWIDTAFLDTLPDREYRSGLAEVVKYGVILDAGFFAWLEANADPVLRREPAAVEHVVARSCELKADVVRQDEREETGLRMVLNYGHTFAHAFESVGGYGAWLHGEAVAAGMVCASRLAERRGLVTAELTARQVALLERFGLPTAGKPGWAIDGLIAVMRRDKKNVGGRLRFILPTRLGEVRAFDDVPEDLVREVLAAS
ncbi:MAG TPA: 3-dehydroquinate synthase [Gemmataceae bacterium]|nr:3-dehydroquinate synthase [Gemmataceae bacterium]